MPKVASSTRPGELDLYQPDGLLHPYRHHARPRRLGPVVFESEPEIRLVPGYAEASHVLRSHEVFVSGGGVTDEGAGDRLERYPLIENDPPVHTRIRRAVQPSFTKGPIERLRPGIESAATPIAEKAVAHTGHPGINRSEIPAACRASPVPASARR